MKVIGQDSKGLKICAESVVNASAAEMANNEETKRRGKSIAIAFDVATENSSLAVKQFVRMHDQLISEQEKLEKACKKTSENVRKSANDLANGLQRIESTANFERLERFTSLLERTASALSTLADLENRGLLTKVGAALK